MQSRRVRWYDVAFAVVMSLMAGVYLLSALDSRPPRLPFAWTQVVLSVGFVPCALWWRVKVRGVGIGVAVLLLGWAASFWVALPINTGVPPVLVMAPLVVYAWTRWLPSRRAGGVIAFVAVAGSWLSPAMWAPMPDGLEYRPQQVVLHWAIIGCAYLLAARQRSVGEARERELRALEAKNEAVLADSHRKEALAVQQERNLIAREIHDVLAHSLTLIQVQSTAGLVAARTAPEAAEDALRTVRGVTNEALAQVREIVTVLRLDGDTTVTPGGDLRDIPTDVEGFRQAGLELSVSIPNEQQLGDAQQRLPLGVRLGARRILQEAMTNALRHGEPRARTRVEFSVGSDVIHLAVSNTAAETSQWSSGQAGNGLRGLSERAASLGGTCRAWRESGTFHVAAEIPLHPAMPDMATKPAGSVPL